MNERLSIAWRALRQRGKHQEEYNFGHELPAGWLYDRLWRETQCPSGFLCPNIPLRNRWAEGVTHLQHRARMNVLAVKAAICVLLGREDRERGYLIPDDYVPTIAIWDMSPWTSLDFPGTAYSWDELSIALGWRRWRYRVDYNSSA